MRIQRAVIYVRISADRTGEELGVNRQLEACQRLADARGMSVVETIPENDVSASGKVARPGFARVLDHLTGGTANVVIAWDMTRLSRNARDTLALLEAGQKADALLAFAAGSDMNLGSADGRTMAGVLASFAQGEIDKKSERQRAASRQAAEQGRRIGGRRPFGYEADGMTIRESEAADYREWCASVLAGVPLGRIATDLNAAGKVTPQKTRAGGPSRWTAVTIRNILLNPRYAGLRSLLTEELRTGGLHPTKARIAGIVGPAQWPALVSEETWRAVVTVLMDPSRVNAPQSAQSLLTGVALCGVCEATVHGGRTVQKHKTYRCSAAYGHVSRVSAPVDEYVSDIVVTRLSQPDAAELLKSDDENAPDARKLREQASTIRARLDALSEEFADDDDADPADYRRAMKRLRERLADTEAQQAAAGRTSVLAPLVLAESAADVWAAMDDDRRRAVIDDLMTIKILPPGRGTRTFRPESVEIDWR